MRIRYMGGVLAWLVFHNPIVAAFICGSVVLAIDLTILKDLRFDNNFYYFLYFIGFTLAVLTAIFYLFAFLGWNSLVVSQPLHIHMTHVMSKDELENMPWSEYKEFARTIREEQNQGKFNGSEEMLPPGMQQDLADFRLATDEYIAEMLADFARGFAAGHYPNGIPDLNAFDVPGFFDRLDDKNLLLWALRFRFAVWQRFDDNNHDGFFQIDERFGHPFSRIMARKNLTANRLLELAKYHLNDKK